MMRRMVLLLCTLPSLAVAQGTADVEALLDSVVPAAMLAEQIPRAVVSVVSGGRVVYSRRYGYADLEARRPMTVRCRHSAAASWK